MTVNPIVSETNDSASYWKICADLNNDHRCAARDRILEANTEGESPVHGSPETIVAEFCDDGDDLARGEDARPTSIYVTDLTNEYVLYPVSTMTNVYSARRGGSRAEAAAAIRVADGMPEDEPPFLADYVDRGTERTKEMARMLVAHCLGAHCDRAMPVRRAVNGCDRFTEIRFVVQEMRNLPGKDEPVQSVAGLAARPTSAPLRQTVGGLDGSRSECASVILLLLFTVSIVSGPRPLEIVSQVALSGLSQLRHRRHFRAMLPIRASSLQLVLRVRTSCCKNVPKRPPQQLHLNRFPSVVLAPAKGEQP